MVRCRTSGAWATRRRPAHNPKVPKSRPREIPDERWTAIFGALRSNRDRALLSLDISNAARAGELLGVRAADLDWGDQLVKVSRKGSDDFQWLPAGPDAFVWLRLYLAEPGPPEPNAGGAVRRPSPSAAYG
ncbi:hypothetical protein [Embleya sp. NPDC001921]